MRHVRKLEWSKLAVGFPHPVEKRDYSVTRRNFRRSLSKATVDILYVYSFTSYRFPPKLAELATERKDHGPVAPSLNRLLKKLQP